jgi:hypothetical protein
VKAAVYLVSPLGGQERRVAEISRTAGIDWPRGLAWTSDGKSLVVTDRNSDSEPLGLCLLSVVSGDKRSDFRQKCLSIVSRLFFGGHTRRCPRNCAWQPRYLSTYSFEDFQPIGGRNGSRRPFTFSPVWTRWARDYFLLHPT